MQVTNNTSPSFGSIQVNISKMNNYQRGVSNKLFRAIKYSENYSPIAEKDVDIYFYRLKVMILKFVLWIHTAEDFSEIKTIK